MVLNDLTDWNSSSNFIMRKVWLLQLSQHNYNQQEVGEAAFVPDKSFVLAAFERGNTTTWFFIGAWSSWHPRQTVSLKSQNMSWTGRWGSESLRPRQWSQEVLEAFRSRRPGKGCQPTGSGWLRGELADGEPQRCAELFFGARWEGASSFILKINV